jgi:hypothetical protein
MDDVPRMVRLLDPTAAPSSKEKPLARRHTTLQGKRVGILDNTKSNADVLMLHLAELLCQEYGASTVVHQRKAHAAIGATAELLAAMSEQCDVVLLGSGD